MGLVEFEVDEPREIGNLSQRNRYGVNGRARQLQINEIANLLDRPDLELVRKTSAEILGWNVGARRQNEHRRAVQRSVGNGGHADAVLLRFDGNGNGALL